MRNFCRVVRENALFDYIAEATDKSIKDFLHKYIDGNDYPDVPSMLKRHGYKYELVSQKDGYYFPIRTYNFREDDSVLLIEFTAPVLEESKGTTIEFTQINDQPVSANSLGLIYRRLFPEQTRIPIAYIADGMERGGYIQPVIYKAPVVPYYPKITINCQK